MRNLKLFLFTLVAFFVVGFAVNVNAEDIATLDGVVSENGVLKLTGDLTLENQLPYFDIVNETLDLNGYNIYTNGHDLTAIGTVSIIDSSQAKTGKISNGPGSENSSVLIWVGITSEKGTLTLESGTIEATGDTWAVFPVNGDFIMNGGTINTEYIFRTYGGNITINGGTINSEVNSSKNLFDVTANKKLTINGGTINNSYVGEGTISIGTIDLKDNASFEMNGGTINSNMSGIVTNSNNVVTINGGTIHSRAFSLVGNGSKTNTNFNINGGTLISENSVAIYAPQMEGTTIIKNGEIIGATSAIEIRAGELTINGGTFTSTHDGEAVVVTPNGNGSTTVGAALAIAQHITKSPINVTINGGTFNGVAAVYESNPQENEYADISKVSMSITGGTFNATSNDPVHSEDLSKFITGGTYNVLPDSVYVAEGYKIFNDKGIYVVHTKNIEDAVITGIKNQTYNGKQQRQDSLVVEINDQTLVKDVDYQVLYSSLTNAGNVTMTIKGIGDYEGKITKTFVRYKVKNPLKFTYNNKTVYYSKVKNSAQVVKPIYVSKKVGTLTYTKMSGSSAKLLLNKTTGKVTVKKGTPKGKYKIRIKVYASGNVNYYSNYAIRTIYVTVK